MAEKTITAYFQNFKLYLKAKNRSALTIHDYEIYFKSLLPFTGNISPQAITLSMVDGFEKTLLERKLYPVIPKAE